MFRTAVIAAAFSAIIAPSAASALCLAGTDTTDYLNYLACEITDLKRAVGDYVDAQDRSTQRLQDILRQIVDDAALLREENDDLRRQLSILEGRIAQLEEAQETVAGLD